MELIILESGSHANGYILHNSTSALLIECGLPLSKYLDALNFEHNKIVGCLLSHEHKDHARYVNDFLSNSIDIYTSQGTSTTLAINNPKIKNIKNLEVEKAIKLENFVILPFKAYHDAAQPFGYIIQHPEMGTLLFATDTYKLPYNFKNINHYMIECNYQMQYLKSHIEGEGLPKTVLARIINSHMSLENAKRVLLSNDLSYTYNIIPIHLSQGNIDPKECETELIKATGKRVIVAKNNLRMDLLNNPF